MSGTGAGAAAGWYDDPAGSGQKRWWDGTQWTENLHDPALEVYGAQATPVVSAGTPVYNAFIWLIVLLPLLSIAGLVTFDLSDYLSHMVQSSSSSAAMMFSPAYLTLVLSGWLIYLVTVLLAYFDAKRLGRDGFVRPFHWAWAFLGSTVYIIGRSVVVKRRSGRGLLPIWIMIAVFVLSVSISIAKVLDAASTAFTNVQFS
ncbi:DUF2510 domain-containing protein [Parafrigoribacterium soli]|uniref:DUF2510 domain-containing protein n=1 Tax=Parafrigoribacterium soli TaxID=3144663 RepID=UPI0032EC2235